MTMSRVQKIDPYLYSPYPMPLHAFIILSACDLLNVGIRYSMATAKGFGMKSFLLAPMLAAKCSNYVGMRQVSDNAPLFAEAR